MASRKLRLGTRGSKLALWQSEWVRDRILAEHPGIDVEVVVIRTTGDKILDSPLSKIGDKGLFTKEIEVALLEQRIDGAVHSLKDLPTLLPDGLTIGAVLKREDVRDVFIPHPSNPTGTLSSQHDGAVIATGSLRRKAQILNRWKSFSIVDLRGNLETRLRKLDASSWAGMVLAAAGVKRMGYADRIGELLPLETVLPAVGQGAVAVEIRAGDMAAIEFMDGLHDRATARATDAERALLRRLEGGCQIPIGAYGYDEANGALRLDAVVGSLDGKTIVRGHMTGDRERPETIGIALAEQLLKDGAQEILREIRDDGKRESGAI